MGGSVGELVWRLTVRLNRTQLRVAKRGVREVGDEVRRAENSAGRFRRAMAGVAISIAAIAGVKLLRGVVSTVAEFERLGNVLVTIEGSTDAAAAAQARLQAMATELPSTLTQLTNAWIMLRGAGLAPTEDMFHELSNVSATFGADVGDLVDAALKAARGMPRALEGIMRTEIKVEDDTLNIMTPTGEELVPMELTELLDWLREQGRTRFGGGVNRHMNSLIGATSNLAVAWEKMVGIIGDFGFRKGLTEFVKAVTEGVGDVNKLAETIGQKLGAAFLVAADAVRWLRENTELFRLAASALATVALVNLIVSLRRLAVVFNAATWKLSLLLAGLAFLAIALDDLWAFMEGRPSLLGEMLGQDERARAGMANFFDGLLGTIKSIPKAIGHTAKALAHLGMVLGDWSFDRMQDLVAGWDAFRVVLHDIMNLLQAVLNGLVSLGRYTAVLDWDTVAPDINPFQEPTALQRENAAAVGNSFFPRNMPRLSEMQADLRRLQGDTSVTPADLGPVIMQRLNNNNNISVTVNAQTNADADEIAVAAANEVQSRLEENMTTPSGDARLFTDDPGMSVAP